MDTANTANTELASPFGLRHLVSPPDNTNEAPVMSYSESLQLNVSADGNPWHAKASSQPETQTETSSGDGQRPGSDSGTDFY